MKKSLLIVLFLFFVNSICLAQEAGNRIYGNRGFNTKSSEPRTNNGNLANRYPDNPKYSIEASVLINLKADSFVAVFGVQQEAKTANQSNAQVNQQIAKFKTALSNLGIPANDIYVDFITQNRIYDFRKSGNDLVETLSGFETKKTVAIRYKDRKLFEKLVNSAATVGIFDLVKVDYIIADFKNAQTKLFDEAATVIRDKKAKYEQAFNLQLVPLGLENKKFQTFYPSDRYEKYQAYESGQAYTNYRSGQRILKRKTATFFYEPLDASKFDKVLTPFGIEPLVQVTLYVRMNYLTKSAPKKKKATQTS